MCRSDVPRAAGLLFVAAKLRAAGAARGHIPALRRFAHERRHAMTTAQFHNRVIAVLDQVGGLLNSIDELDAPSFEEFDSKAVLRLTDAQAALRAAARVID